MWIDNTDSIACGNLQSLIEIGRLQSETQTRSMPTKHVSADKHDKATLCGMEGKVEVPGGLAENVSAVAEQNLQPCSCSGVGLSCSATPEVALEQNPISLVVLHACYIEGVKAKHHIPQLLYDFARKLHVLLSAFFNGPGRLGLLYTMPCLKHL